jgi:hypothetical protein
MTSRKGIDLIDLSTYEGFMRCGLPTPSAPWDVAF